MKQPDKIKHTLIIVISPDKGLCGGLITNLIKQLPLQKIDNNVYVGVGKKGSSLIAGLGKEIVATFDFGTMFPKLEAVYPIIKVIDKYFLSGQVDSVKVLYSSFGSIFSQVPKVTDLLPINLPEKKVNPAEPLFEPSASVILPIIAKRYLETTLYQFLMENYISEQAARMISMQNATDNALDIVDTLKLKYNKSRQEKITNEILDMKGDYNSSSEL